MENIKIIIPTMINSHQILEVDRAIHELSGAEAQEVSPGLAMIKLAGASKETLLREIHKLGYKDSYEAPTDY